MRKISDRLYQASAAMGFEIPKEVNVIFWMCGNAPKRDHALSTDRTLIDYHIDDDAERGVPPEVFQTLVEYAQDYADACVLTVCAAGENRSGLMSVLTLIARGSTVNDAIRTVQENGNINSKPAHEHGHSFWNSAFEAQVRNYFDGTV